MTFTRATQMAFQSLMLGLLSLAAAALGSLIPGEFSVLREICILAAFVTFVAAFICTVATLFMSDQEIDATDRQKSKVQ